MRNVNIKVLRDGIIQYKAEINKIDEEAMELGKRFQEEQRKRDSIANKESAQYELQNNITEEVLKELRKKNEKRNHLEERAKNTINVVRFALEKDKEEIAKKTLEFQNRKKKFEMEKKEFEDLISRDESNPIIKDNDQIMQNRRKKVEQLKKDITDLDIEIQENIEQIDEINNKLKFVDYNNIEDYKEEEIETEKDSEENKNTEKDSEENENIEKEETEKDSTKSEKAEKDVNIELNSFNRRNLEQPYKEGEELPREQIEEDVIRKTPYMYISEVTGNIAYYNEQGKREDCNIVYALKNKKDIFKELDIKRICREVTGKRLSSRLLYRKINPEIIAILDKAKDTDMVKRYIEATYNKEELPFSLDHNLEGMNIFEKIKMRKYTRAEEKSGARIIGKIFDRNKALTEGKKEKGLSLAEELDDMNLKEEEKTEIKDYAILHGENSARRRFTEKIQGDINNTDGHIESNATEKVTGEVISKEEAQQEM